jgi:predicted PurR-regulated permease PerM
VNFGQWIGFLSILLSLGILWQVRELLLLVFTAVIFATALNRLVRYWVRLGIRRNWAIAVTLLLSLSIIILFFGLMIPPFIEQFQKLLELLPSVWERVRFELMRLRQEQQQFDWLPLPPTLADLIQQLEPLTTYLFRNFFAVFSNSVTALLQLLLVVVLTIMLLINPLRYRYAAIKLFPSFYRRRADEIFSLSEVALANWLTGIVINCLFIGLLSGIGLWILQIKLVLVHAILAGLLNFIPNIGPAASVVFPIVVALLDAPWKVWAILIWYFIIQNIESYLLTPTVMAKQVSLLPAVTLMAQIFFAQMFGLLGLLLALPLTVVAKTWTEEVLFKDILDRWLPQKGTFSYQFTSLISPISRRKLNDEIDPNT